MQWKEASSLQKRNDLVLNKKNREVYETKVDIEKDLINYPILFKLLEVLGD